jgi:hypothetical protein
MAVGFKVKHYWYRVGQGDFLHSFFSTISYRLEPDGWGSKYPYLLKHLYSGRLNSADISKAVEETKQVQIELSKYKPSELVWDIEDMTKQPPWGDKISTQITNLANYFVTSDGRNLFEILFKAFEDAQRLSVDVEIESL